MKIQEGIDHYLNKNTVRFFMPGHKGSLSAMDVTELDGTDNLHFPDGIIREAQDAVAKAYGVLHTFFSVNGSSAGLHGAILSACKPGDSIAVDRGCHISVLNALILYGITPVFLYPEIHRGFGVSCGIRPEAVKDLLRQNPAVKAVLVTSPTYYGVCSDIRSIAHTAHLYDVPLIVDEAHGAHLHFCQKLPDSAVSQGADIVVQSAHKTLECLTQGAMVHLCSKRIKKEQLQRSLNMVQTTSPSYLLMDSIENAVAAVREEPLNKLVDTCNELREALNETGKYKCMEQCEPFYAYDASRLVFAVNANTSKIRRTLHDKYNIVIEMDDGHNIVCMPTPSNRQEDFKRLKHALLSLCRYLQDYQPVCNSLFPRTTLVMPPHEAYYAEKELVQPSAAVGKIAGESVYQSPPCMPVLCPGEQITAEIAGLLKEPVEIVK